MTRNIPLFKVYMSESIAGKLDTILFSGYVGQGEKVKEFEGNVKNYYNNDFILTTNSATSAEHLAILLLKRRYGNWPGIDDGDIALCSAQTCTASNFPFLLSNMNIQWVDCDLDTLNMDLDDLARKINNRTKVVMIPLWGGMPIDFNRLSEIQNRSLELYGFKPAIIIDAAHGIKSKYCGEYVCNLGHITTFSLQAIKHVTSVDGGLLCLPHDNLYRRGKLLRWYGIDREQERTDMRCETDIKEAGTKWHMNDINATIGIENFKDIDKIVSLHQENAAFYDSELHNIDRLKLLKRFSDRESSFWIYSILVDRKKEFVNMMNKKGIQVSKVHERNDIHSCVNRYRSQLPNLDYISDRIINIPVGWWVTKEDREYIVNCITKGW